MAAKSIRFRGRSFVHGEILVAPGGLPGLRGDNGLLPDPDRLFLVLYNEEQDEMTLEPISWAVAQHAMQSTLHFALAMARG